MYLVVAAVLLIVLWIAHRVRSCPVEFRDVKAPLTRGPLRIVTVQGVGPTKLTCARTGSLVLQTRGVGTCVKGLLDESIDLLRIESPSGSAVLSASLAVATAVGGFVVSVRRPLPKPVWEIHRRFATARLDTGASLHVSRAGQSDEVVLFVPGRGSLMDSEEFLDSVEGSGRTMAVLYYRGHSYSNPREEALDCSFPEGTLDSALDDVASAVRAIRKTSKRARVRLVGYSLGGLIASLYLKRKGHKCIEDLVLFCPFLCARRQTGMHPVLAWASSVFSRPFLSTYAGEPVIRGPAVVQKSLYFIHHGSWSGLRFDGNETKAAAAVPASFVSAFSSAMMELELTSKPLSIPVLMITSSTDTVVDSAASISVARHIFDILQIEDLEAAGHFPVNGLLCEASAAQARKAALRFWHRK